jgi:trehalose-6-phosphate synthase
MNRLGAAKRLDRAFLDQWKATESTAAMDRAIQAKFAKGNPLASKLVQDTSDKTLVEYVTEFVSCRLCSPVSQSPQRRRLG